MDNELWAFMVIVGIVVAAIVSMIIIGANQEPITPDPLPEPIPTPEPVVTTQAEMNDYAVSLIFPCEGDNMSFQTTNDHPLPAMNFTPDGRVYYGYPASTLRPVDERTPKSGRQVWRVIIDPNNGWVRETICDYNRYEGCPKEDDGNWTWIRESPFNNPDTEEYQALPYQRREGTDSMIIEFLAFAECNSITEWYD